MDAFEKLMATLLRRERCWVRESLKVDLTKEDKRKIGRPSSPRWEIDLVGYKGDSNEILAVECKSFLDSRGVLFRNGRFEPANRYKLFSESDLREVVVDRLRQQLVESGACAPNARVRLALAAGKITSGTDRRGLERQFSINGWELFDDRAIRAMLTRSAEAGYENDPVLVATKILIRGQ